MHAFVYSKSFVGMSCLNWALSVSMLEKSLARQQLPAWRGTTTVKQCLRSWVDLLPAPKPGQGPMTQ
eukprot:scaffold57296_cov23-Tisochrysis_lutea.AAC.1